MLVLAALPIRHFHGSCLAPALHRFFVKSVASCWPLVLVRSRSLASFVVFRGWTRHSFGSASLHRHRSAGTTSKMNDRKRGQQNKEHQVLPNGCFTKVSGHCFI